MSRRPDLDHFEEQHHARALDALRTCSRFVLMVEQSDGSALLLDGDHEPGERTSWATQRASLLMLEGWARDAHLTLRRQFEEGLEEDSHECD